MLGNAYTQQKERGSYQRELPLEYLVALGLVIIALQDRCYPEWIPAAS